jgi:hypothetical protein
MHSSDELADALRCQDVVVRFTCHFDAGEAEAMLALFAPDGIWHRREAVVRGREALRALLAARAGEWLTRHLLSNLRTTRVDADHAVVDCYVTAYRAAPPAAGGAALLAPPVVVGRYRDALLRVDGQWLIARRELFDDFKP